ncbi:unnamed protein product [Adineta ricciae]|uniref:Uncharacterized protein n=1 Tax=Adineta ricciae TaxID=249248 RepID=A0A814I1C1_ADIRI|nr:unnamed protein product [Adineta ricciae]
MNRSSKWNHALILVHLENIDQEDKGTDYCLLTGKISFGYSSIRSSNNRIGSERHGLDLLLLKYISPTKERHRLSVDGHAIIQFIENRDYLGNQMSDELGEDEQHNVQKLLVSKLWVTVCFKQHLDVGGDGVG